MKGIKALTQPERYADGDTLYLTVWPGGPKSWLQRVIIKGRCHDIGLGPWPVVNLSAARRQAFANPVLIDDGGDPPEARRAAVAPTFREAAEAAYRAAGIAPNVGPNATAS